MSLTGKIMNLFADKEKTIPLFPRTKIKAVSDDDGVGLNVVLDTKLSTTGGELTGTLIVNGVVLTEGVDYGSNLPASGVTGQLYFKKVT